MSTERAAVVIGGGPAGVSTAISLTQEGIQPVIIEKEVFPRYHIGESMLPKGMEVLRELGLLSRVEAESFVLKPGARFYSSAHQVDVSLSFADAPGAQVLPQARQVERERFDEILLDGARDAGVEIWSSSRVTAIESGDREVKLRVERPDGVVEVAAPLVFDATGQSSLTARLRGYRRRIPSLLTHAFFGYFRGLARNPGPDGGNILICFVPGGWIWYIPLRDDVTSVGVVLVEGAERPAGGVEEILLETMARHLPDPESRQDYQAKLVSEARAYSAINFCSQRYVDDRVLLVGDAAAFLDPVFSTGVFLGMWGGRMAAQTAAAGLRAGDVSRAALVSYETKMMRAHRVALELVQMFYRGHFVLMLDRVARGNAASVRDVVGLLTGDFLDEGNALARALMARTQDDVPLA